MKKSATVTIEGRTFPRGARLLRIVTVCGVRVPVIRATAAQCPELAEADGSVILGFYCPDRACILVLAGQSRTQERDSITHELVHAFISLSGLGALLAASTVWPKGYDDLEETLVRIATPHLSTVRLAP